jgi:large subunit ribosomal protein L18
MANTKTESMQIRKKRIRRSLKVTTDRPRLSVFRSNKHIYAQIIDDVNQKTLVCASTVSKELKEKISKKSDVTAAVEVGKLIGKLAKEAKIEKVAFDRGSYLYHGKIKALADAARAEGLQF